MSEETQKRESWAVETGELLEKDRDTRVNIYESATASDIEIYQIQPVEVEKRQFYLTITWMCRTGWRESLETLKAEGGYTLENPLAVWNPYGTGTNGLYLYFETEDPSLEVHYTVHTEKPGDPGFSGPGKCRGHSPERISDHWSGAGGKTARVTVSLTDSQGDTVREATFETEVPQTLPGMTPFWNIPREDSEEELTGRSLLYLRYSGILRTYVSSMIMKELCVNEMLLDGYKADRILTEGSDIIFCVSADQIGRMNPLGQVVRLYETKGYDMAP